MPKLQRIWIAALGFGLGLGAAGCSADGTSKDSSGADVEPRVLEDLPRPEEDAAVEDVPALSDCQPGETRPCGTDEGECIGGIEHCVDGLWSGVCEGERVPAEERCNEKDDDCDGSVDEDFPLGVTCKFEDARGIQRDGTQQCDLDTGEMVCEPGMDCRVDADADGVDVCDDCDDNDGFSFPGAPERCDGLDNDCNDRIDETFPLDEICYVGEGLCRRGGRTICGPEGEAACDAEPGEPLDVERCGDELDNDCDGETDEGFDLGGACTGGLGACAREGTFACSEDGGEAVCDAPTAAPGEERCGNGEDDDCDGETDEGFAAGAACEVGLGACHREGVLLCDAASGREVCNVASALPGLELCGNRTDDDCDGETDEGFELGAACTAGEGECRREGVRVCTRDGRGTTCSAEPGAPREELCGTGVDEDCDGETDEGFDVGILCTAGEGECARLGVEECTPNRLGTVCGASPGPPGLEICNGLDDDCDGLTDEGFAVGGACRVGVGACQADGQIACDINGGLYCRAQAAPPGLERCGNGQDDDCDGSTDEGFDVGEVCTAGQGQCAVQGRTVCDVDGLGTRCDAVAGVPSPEVCGNLLDEDCDGTADEGFDVGAPCVVGIGACRREGQKVCSVDGSTTTCSVVAGPTRDELCGTGVDEDCDGLTDEGFDVGAACTVGRGECFRRGQNVCSADGLSTVCGAAPGQPLPERCDGLDNDCDDQVDDGFDVGQACTVGFGRCAVQGDRICRPDGAGTACDAEPLPPQQEICDHIDNDCDNQVDEDFPELDQVCDSANDADICALGYYDCDPGNGRMVCVDDVESPEVCDYRDNDCDGVADNGFDLSADENNCGACGAVCPLPFGHCREAICYRQYWVDAVNGSNGPLADGSRARPWRTITRALAVVRGPRAVVEILPGTYSVAMHPTEFETFPLSMRDGVELEGFGQAGTIIVDAATNQGIFRLQNGPDVNNRLENLVLDRAGRPAPENSPFSAITVENSVLTVRDVLVRNASVPNQPAAISATGATTRVTCDHCRFVNNVSSGVGMIVQASAGAQLRIEGSHFQQNTALPLNWAGDPRQPGGVVGAVGGRVDLVNTTIVGNAGNAMRAEFPGGNLFVTNCTLADNTGSGIVVAGNQTATVQNNIIAFNDRYGYVEDTAANDPLLLVNNLFWLNGLGHYVNEGDYTPAQVRNTVNGINTAVSPAGNGRGTILGDPLFFSLPAPAFNVRLRAGSPAIDAGDAAAAPVVDQDGRPRPQGAAPDLGAFEF